MEHSLNFYRLHLHYITDVSYSWSYGRMQIGSVIRSGINLKDIITRGNTVSIYSHAGFFQPHGNNSLPLDSNTTLLLCQDLEMECKLLKQIFWISYRNHSCYPAVIAYNQFIYRLHIPPIYFDINNDFCFNEDIHTRIVLHIKYEVYQISSTSPWINYQF